MSANDPDFIVLGSIFLEFLQRLEYKPEQSALHPYTLTDVTSISNLDFKGKTSKNAFSKEVNFKQSQH